MEGLKQFISVGMRVYHAAMVWAKADKVFCCRVLLVFVNVVKVNNFVKATDGTGFCEFAIGFEVYAL